MTIEQRISITAIVITWVIVWLIARAEQKKAGSTPARLPRLGTTGAWFDSATAPVSKGHR